MVLDRTDAVKRAVGVAALGTAGVLYATLFGWMLMMSTDPIERDVLNVISLGFAVALVVGVVRLHRELDGGDQVLRVAAWAFGATVPIVVVGFLGLGWELAVDGRIEGGEVVVWYLSVVGTVGGFLIGRYDVERRQFASELEALVEAAPTAIVAVDTHGRVTTYNDSAEEIFGWTREEAMGSVPPFVPEASREEFQENVQRVIDGEDLRGEHAVRRRKDGSPVDVELWTSTITEDDGDVAGIMTVLIDVTAQKRQDQAMSVLRRILRHNLRNDGDVIMGHSQRIREAVGRLPGRDGVHGEIEHSVSEIDEAARNLVTLGEKARTMEQVLQDEQRDPVRVDACRILRELRGKFEAQYPLAEIRLECPGPVMLELPCRIELAFEEVIENAIEHADCEDPTVEVRVEQNGEWVTVEVADDGPGVPELEVRALQESEESALVHSSGLGLWLVKWLVTGVGGSISLHENDAGGCTAVLTFPNAPGVGPGDRSRSSPREERREA